MCSDRTVDWERLTLRRDQAVSYSVNRPEVSLGIVVLGIDYQQKLGCGILCPKLWQVLDEVGRLGDIGQTDARIDKADSFWGA